jgi:hypothetical protein
MNRVRYGAMGVSLHGGAATGKEHSKGKDSCIYVWGMNIQVHGPAVRSRS